MTTVAAGGRVAALLLAAAVGRQYRSAGEVTDDPRRR